MNKLYVCMECGYEWEAEEVVWCPICKTADFAEEVIEEEE